MQVPAEIGSKLEIPAHRFDWKDKLEARGFWPEAVSPRTIVMRRDYPDGVLAGR